MCQARPSLTSTRRPKATRGAERLSGTTCIALSSSGSVDSMRCEGDLHIGFLSLDTDPAAAQAAGHCASGPGPEERVQHHVARLGAGEQDAVEQGLRLLRRMGLDPVLALHSLLTAADRQHPVRPHLKIVVQRLHCTIIKSVARLLVLRAPDERLVGVGETGAAKVRHRVRLAPDRRR